MRLDQMGGFGGWPGKNNKDGAFDSHEPLIFESDRSGSPMGVQTFQSGEMNQ